MSDGVKGLGTRATLAAREVPHNTVGRPQRWSSPWRRPDRPSVEVAERKSRRNVNTRANYVPPLGRAAAAESRRRWQLLARAVAHGEFKLWRI